MIEDSDDLGGLHNSLDILFRRRWIVLSVWLATISAAAAILLTTPPLYETGALLNIEKERGQTASNYASGVLVDNSNADYFNTQYELLRSESLCSKIYDQLKLSAAADFSEPSGITKLRGAISVAPIPRSRLAYVKARSHDPQLAARIANAIAEAYVAENIRNQLFISKDLLLTLQASPSDPKTRRLYEVLPPVVNSSVIQSLKGDYAKLETQWALLSERLTLKHPTMAGLRSQRESISRQISAETDRVIQSLKTELSGQLMGNNVRIIDPAKVPDIPIKPKIKFGMMVASLLGLGLAFLAAGLVNFFDQTVRTQEDVERKLGAAFLGMLPQIKPSQAKTLQALTESANSLTGEAFRNLRTMVDFALVSGRNKALLVTSSIQSEGKTYVSANLAIAFAQIGERVLLISGDLRRPRLHKMFEHSNQKGISSFLANGSDVAELDELVSPTDIPGLNILHCGIQPPNPSELLNTPRLGALAAWAQSRFDRVIIDSTPLFPVSDTLLWGRHVPAAVFVVRYGFTRVPVIHNALQKLKTAAIKVHGVIINEAKLGGLTYYSYGSSQYYQDYHQPQPEGRSKSHR